jgi:hypothetical protein
LTAPKKSPSSNSTELSQRNALRVYFLLPALEALVAVVLVFVAPSENSNAWLLGLSKTRWLLVAGLFALALIFSALSWTNLHNLNVWPRIQKWLSAVLGNSVIYSVLIILSLLGAVLFFYLGLLTFKFSDALVHVRLLRLLPFFLWILLFSAQTLIILPQIRYGKDWQKRVKPRRETLLSAMIGIVLLGLSALFISVARLGLQPDRTGWDVPGVPLMATQVLLAWLVALLFYALVGFLEKKTGWKLSRFNWLACAGLWLLAIYLWQSQPLTPTFFAPTPRAPNYEFYPYSDAASHDLVAQNLLIGEGFTPVAEKPLYSFFLAILHVLVGQDYLNVVFAQVAVLALFPAVLYLLASQMQHRFSGALLGLAVILRERNTIALSGQIDVSHAKLLMTDLPTALALALLMLLLFRWLKADPRALRWPLLVGGSFGAILLLRSQTLVFLPALLMLAVWRGGKELRARAIYASLLLLGFALVALPWMIRNAARTGQFGYSQPLQALYMAKQYSLTPEANDPGFPANTPISDYVPLGLAHVADFVRMYPGEVTRFITTHFLHNEVSSFLTLPIRFDFADKIVSFYNLRPYWIGAEDRLWKECCSLSAHIANNPYWDNWDGIFPPEARLPILFNLTMVALGLGAAWHRSRWLGLLPAGLHLVYNLSTAVARVSGWRLNLPVDWVSLLYYCLGIGQLSLWVWAYLSASPTVTALGQKTETAMFGWKQEKLTRSVVLILAAGLLLPFSEIVIPARYEKVADAAAVAAWQGSSLAPQTLDMAAFLDQPGAVALNGRALWPRYYAAEMGEPGGQWAAFNPLPFARVGFVLIGPLGDQVVLPLQTSPAAFPNASDVLVFGCEEDGYLRAVAVLFPSHAAPDLLTDLGTPSCSTEP